MPPLPHPPKARPERSPPNARDPPQRLNRTLNAAAALFCPSRTGARLKAGIFADRSRVKILDLQQWDGPVYDLISRAEFYVLSNIRRRLIIDGSPAREEVPEIPHAAFREAIVSAFCHRDRTDYGTAAQIDIYPATVEVTNPGTFPAGRTPEMYLSDEVVAPKSRNPLIASTLFRSKTIESFGSGIKHIRDTCAEAGVRLEYTQAHGATTVCLHRNDPYGEPLGTDTVPSGSKWFQADDPEAGLSESEYTSSNFSATAIVRRSSRLLTRRIWAAGAPSNSSVDSLSADSSPQRAPRGRSATTLPNAADGASARAADRDGG